MLWGVGEPPFSRLQSNATLYAIDMLPALHLTFDIQPMYIIIQQIKTSIIYSHNSRVLFKQLSLAGHQGST